jgi:uncharacterized SAM-binding protein YcdF (DUF218 family)
VNHLFILLGIEAWKPVLTALVLPPVPFLVAILVGARLLLPRRGWGWGVIVVSVAGLWLTSTTGMGYWLEKVLLPVPPLLKPDRIDTIRHDERTRSGMAIVVLGGGAEPLAPEYGVSNLGDLSLQRLRYGLWLARETGVPVGFSGGAGWGRDGEGTEADTAARIAGQEFNRPLRWTENASRDTRENAARMVPLLKRAGITHILLVTHGWHMPRALRHFEEAAGPAGIRVEAAPMGLARHVVAPVLEWMPTGEGYRRVRYVVREAIGGAMGA